MSLNFYSGKMPYLNKNRIAVYLKWVKSFTDIRFLDLGECFLQKTFQCNVRKTSDKCIVVKGNLMQLGFSKESDLTVNVVIPYA